MLTYAQQSKELANTEQDNLAKRIQEFRTQAELDQLRASSNINASTSAVGINGVGMSSNKIIDAIMQSTAKGEVMILYTKSFLQVWKCFYFHEFLWDGNDLPHCVKAHLSKGWIVNRCLNLIGPNNQARISLKTFLQLEGRLEEAILCP